MITLFTHRIHTNYNLRILADKRFSQITVSPLFIFSPIMKCVVCERSATTVKLVTVSNNKLCSSCKTAYYRGLTKLFEYIHHRNIKLDSPTDCEKVVWEYLNEHKYCLKQLVFKRSTLCNLQGGNKP